jgi:hypothetical protein
MWSTFRNLALRSSDARLSLNWQDFIVCYRKINEENRDLMQTLLNIRLVWIRTDDAIQMKLPIQRALVA